MKTFRKLDEVQIGNPEPVKHVVQVGIGTRFKYYDGDVYIVASVARNEVLLVNISTGGRWSSPVVVGMRSNLTQGEVQRLISPCSLKDFLVES